MSHPNNSKGSIEHRDKLRARPDFTSTRHAMYDDDDGKINRPAPRLGRRESEPHSAEINYMHDVFTTNFPDGRVLWDLHHYFIVDGIKRDIQFDISFFKDFQLDEDLSSYDASNFGNRVPDLAINVLSKGTWHDDIGLHVDLCRAIGIPVYIIFLPYPVAGFPYSPPFLRVYSLQDDGNYSIRELRSLSVDRTGGLVLESFIDLSPVLSLKVGLIEKERFYYHRLREYRLIFLDVRSGDTLKTRLETSIKEKEEVIKEKEEALKEKEAALRERDEIIKEKEEALKEKERIITELKAKLKENMK
ncbi:MAG: hypothetical protein ACTSWN_01545 [Promethearchaeota archaeon]